VILFFLRAMATAAISYAVTAGGGAANRGADPRVDGQLRNHGLLDPREGWENTTEAGLDTGSTGLRVLPGVLAPGDATDGSQKSPGACGSGYADRGGGGEASRVGDDVVDGVGCGGGCVEDDVADEGAIDEALDAKILRLIAGLRPAPARAGRLRE